MDLFAIICSLLNLYGFIYILLNLWDFYGIFNDFLKPF